MILLLVHLDFENYIYNTSHLELFSLVQYYLNSFLYTLFFQLHLVLQYICYILLHQLVNQIVMLLFLSLVLYHHLLILSLELSQNETYLYYIPFLSLYNLTLFCYSFFPPYLFLLTFCKIF